MTELRPIEWREQTLYLLDQRRLPGEEIWVACCSAEQVADAIASMIVRGAPAIGISAAYGVVLAAQRYAPESTALEQALVRLADARPTAVNLHWALARMRAVMHKFPGDGAALLDAARALHAQEHQANIRMGAFGADWFGKCTGLLTHCNTGALATGGVGTAFAVINTAFQRGALERAYATETRPWLQGMRLTVWELQRAGIPTTLLCDSAAASLLASGAIQGIIVGADRIAANGDVVNKIGTYGLALAARTHQVPFMVVAPCSTIDWETSNGTAIKLEYRSAQELLRLGEVPLGVPECEVYNPVFDMTPASLISALVTEVGVIESPDHSRMQQWRATLQNKAG